MEPIGPTVAVGAIVVRPGHLLMVRRAHDPGRGRWSLPGGRVERGEYAADALRREIAEETGLEVEVTGFAGFFEVIGDGHHYVILDFTAEAAPDSEPTASGDADDARWVPLDEVTQLDLTPRLVETLRGWGVLP